MPHCRCYKKHSNCDHNDYNHDDQYSKFQSLLGPCEYILFSGTYDVLNWNVAPSSTPDYSVASNILNLSINSSGYNSVTGTSIKNTAKPLGSPVFLTENVYLASYDNSLENKLGAINIQSSFPFENDGLVFYDVSSNNGIFKNVNRVLVDYKSSLTIRTVYFIGNY